MAAGYDECEAIVRRDDPDRAVAVVFAPAGKRLHLNALYAFDCETARIRQIVSQPLPGEIRLQWWRDRIEAQAVDALEAGGQGSPVAAALLDTIAACALPAEAATRLLEARIFDLYDDAMPSRGDLEAYAGETASAVLMLAAMILDPAAAPRAADVAGHAGVAKVVADALRLWARRPEQGQIFFPGDVLDAVACPREALSSRGDERRERAVEAFAAFGREHLSKARAGLGGLPRSLRPAFLPIERLDASLAVSASRPANPDGGTTSLKRLFAYWRAMRR